jgi:hypothetical protein
MTCDVVTRPSRRLWSAKMPSASTHSVEYRRSRFTRAVRYRLIEDGARDPLIPEPRSIYKGVSDR